MKINFDKDSHFKMVLINLFLFVTIFFILLRNNIKSLYFGLDGSYTLELTREYSNLQFIFGYQSAILKGISNVYFPLNPWLDPGLLLLVIFGQSEGVQILSYVIFALELGTAAFLVCKIVDLPIRTCTLGFWILPLVALPLFDISAIYQVMMLIPHLSTGILVTVLIIACYQKIGQVHKSGHIFISAIVYASIIFLLTCYIALAQPALLIIMLPVLVIFNLALLLSCKSIVEIKFKAYMALLLLLGLSIGPMSYLYGLFTYTAPGFFSADFHNDRMSLGFASIVFHRVVGPLIVIASVFGVVIKIRAGSISNKYVFKAFLYSLVLLLTCGLLASKFSVWIGPSPIYFEFFLWPFYAAFAAIPIIWIVDRFYKISLINKYVVKYSPARCDLIIIVVTLCIAYHFGSRHYINLAQQYPPSRSIVVDYLKNDIQIGASASPYRGRVATFTGLNIKDTSINWLTLHSLDQQLIRKIHNDHRMVGLWYYNIPTLFEYSPFITPAFHWYTKTFLSIPSDKPLRSAITIRNPDSKFLTNIGVKYIITDKEVDDSKLIKIQRVTQNENLYLYELLNPNIGNYSPTKIIRASSLQEYKELMSSSSFDFKNEVILDREAEVPPNLEAATGVSLNVSTSLIKVTATSQGKTLLLLPFEFSNCLTANGLNGAKLVRANLLQVAIIFEKELSVSIEYKTGPYLSSFCRVQDRNEFKKIIDK